ncbi:MAG: hypothetical protein K0R06_2777 [Clostridium sp.]|nr:hypothetical protein [Clostridium sp.]
MEGVPSFLIFISNVLTKKFVLDKLILLFNRSLQIMEEYRSGHNEPHSKCGSLPGHVGSNPTSSANYNLNRKLLNLTKKLFKDIII